MTTLQTIMIIILAVAFAVYIVRSARVARLDMRYAITWLAVAVGALFIAIFPRVVLWLAVDVLGFEASTNFIFIVAIVVLAVIAFRQTMMLSKQEKRIVKLTQTVALLEYKKGEDSQDGVQE